MTRLLSSVAAQAAAALIGTAALAAPTDPSGTWLTQDARARVRVEPCASSKGQMCGYIVWLRSGASKSALDRYNPDSAKATRPVLGHQMMLGLKPNDDDQWVGTVYNADDGKRYDVTVWSEGSGELRVKGCLVAFLCSTQNWTRVTDVASGQLTGPTGTSGGPTPDPEYAGRPAAATTPRRDPKPKS